MHRGELQTRGLGMRVEVYGENGQVLPPGEKGELVCTAPFPSMPIEFWNDPDEKKYRAAYFETFPGVWHHGDYCELRENGGMVFWGRSDAVLNPGGIRIGTAEIYRIVDYFSEVDEALAVGQRWNNDERIILFVKLGPDTEWNDDLGKRIRDRIRQGASVRHVPAKIIPIGDIPRTLNGKIAELAVRQVIHQIQVKNVDALANPNDGEMWKSLVTRAVAQECAQRWLVPDYHKEVIGHLFRGQFRELGRFTVMIKKVAVPVASNSMAAVEA